MSTTPAPAPSKLASILTIINLALQGLSVIPVIGLEAQVGQAFLTILQAGLNAYHAETGQPIDLTKIPPEAPIP